MLPITALQKLYTMAFMPLAATTLAATIERFEKLSAARRVHDTNFQLVADSMLREQAVIQQSISPELSEEAFVLRVLVEENLVEESTLRELRARYASMRKQGVGLIHGAGRVDRHGVPKTVDAELVFCLLVQQGRVVDSNVHGAQAAQAASADEEGGALLAPSPRVSALRAEAAAMGRGTTRGLMTDKTGDVVVAVDMSVADHGFQEWYAKHWMRTLRACGLEAQPGDWARYAHFKLQGGTSGAAGTAETAGSPAAPSRTAALRPGKSEPNRLHVPARGAAGAKRVGGYVRLEEDAEGDAPGVGAGGKSSTDAALKA